MKVRMLWIRKIREAVSVTPQRIFMAMERDAHQVVIIFVKVYLFANIKIIIEKQ